MFSYIASTITSLLAIWCLYNVFCLARNYMTALRIGLPVVVSLISPDNPLWIALQTSAGSVFRHLPFDAFSLTRHTRLGWEFHDRYAMHQRLGDAWLLVTPARNWLFIANPKTVTSIFNRARDFIHPAWMLEQLSVFGPSISVAEGHDWQRQRKLTAAPFNENKSPLVWRETIRQTKQIMVHWRSLTESGSPDTTDDARTLALNVLAFAAFEKSYTFQASDRNIIMDYERPMTYRDSIATILNNVLVVLVVPQPLFTLPFLPQSWQQVGKAMTFFRQYMEQQIRQEENMIAEGKPSSGSLVSNLVRAGHEDGHDANGQRHKPLTREEILGNIFVFNFAGHDTTAISLGYALLLLVAHRDVQDWVHEEIQYYTKSKAQGDVDPDYKTLFPQLKRCLAVLVSPQLMCNFSRLQ